MILINWTALYSNIFSGLDCFFPIKLHDKDKPLATPEFKIIIGSRQKASTTKSLISAATEPGKQRKLQAQIHLPQQKDGTVKLNQLKK